MTVKLSPIFNGQLVDENGAPAVGWQIKTCVAGSSTLQPTFTDSTGLANHTNPIVCDALGFPGGGPIWLTAGTAYKFFISDENGVLKYFVDGVTGTNDSSITTDEYSDVGVAPTYISVSSYSVPGDQTSEFHKGRRQKLIVTGGTVYGRIVTAVYDGATKTTVTMQMDGLMVLDAGLSIVQSSILRANVLSLPERIATTTGAVNIYVASVGIARLVIDDEYKIKFAIANDGAVAPTLNLDATGALPILTQTGAVPAIGALNGEHVVRATATGFVVLNPNNTILQIAVRQAINSGPVDANGFFAPGGVTGSATVTTTAISPAAPLVVNAAGGNTATGGLGDRIGFSIANLAFTGLSTNGTMFLYVDVVAGGALTPGAGTLLPNYQRGGTFSITSGQFTYNSNVKMQMVGTGAAAPQSFRVYLGEVTVAGGVVTAIIWYRLNNKLDSAPFANPNVAGSVSNFNSNLGLPLNMMKRPYAMATNPTALDGWTAGATYEFFAGNGSTTPPINLQTRNVTTLQAGASASNGFYYQTTPGGAFQSVPASAVMTIHLEGDL